MGSRLQSDDDGAKTIFSFLLLLLAGNFSVVDHL